MGAPLSGGLADKKRKLRKRNAKTARQGFHSALIGAGLTAAAGGLAVPMRNRGGAISAARRPPPNTKR